MTLALRYCVCFFLVGFSLVVNAGDERARKEYITNESFENVIFNLESAISNQGLVVDHVSYISNMLARTSSADDQKNQIYSEARVYLFCSAFYSRIMMEVNPENITYCPFSIALYELTEAPGSVSIIFDMGVLPHDESRLALLSIYELLDVIVKEALGL